MNIQVLNYIIQIKNASLAKRRKVTLPYSKMNKAIGKILVKEGFLQDVREEIKDNKKALIAEITKEKKGLALSDVAIISKPSLSVHVKAKSIPSIRRKGIGTLILSTSHGVMTATEAYKKGLGGELLFRVW